MKGELQPVNFSGVFARGWLLFFILFPLFLKSQDAVVNGIVTNNISGALITGAKVQIGAISTWSVAGGAYSFTVPSGTFQINCSKEGFENLQSPVLILLPGSVTTYDFHLDELTNPPGPSLAYVDTSLNPQGVTVVWDVPSGPYEILYDDGIQDDFSIWAQQGNMFAVKFSPPALPARVTGGKINIGKPENYPAGNPFAPFQIAVYDENSQGKPGNMIGGPFNIVPSSTGWIDFSFASPVQLTTGSFFLVMIQGGNPPNAAGIAVDATSPAGRSFSRFVTGNGSWIPGSGNYLIRAEVTGPGGPLPPLLEKTPLNTSGLLGYTLYRLKQGEELNPAVWTVVGYTTMNKLPDFSWQVLPCGPYRWAVRAAYSNNRQSNVTFSNVIGKCWTRSVTVHVDLSCQNIPVTGTTVNLKNLIYPDTTYMKVLSSDETAFPDVWKGSYVMTVSRFGFQQYVQNVSVNTDTLFNVFLLQEKTPVESLTVNDTTLIARWKKPKPVKELLSENWDSLNFQYNGWTVEGGPNWIISATAGNPEPSAMFNYSPAASDYSQTLTSRFIQGENSAVLKLNYDIFLDSYGTTTINQMAVEIWNGTQWTLLKNYTNSGGDFDWTAQELDISAWSGNKFRIRFRAYGEDSYDINHWNLDNIKIIASEAVAVSGSCVLGYNVYLNNILCNVTTDTSSLLPPEFINYGEQYTACVTAVYASGPSLPVCDNFTSSYLRPPTNLTSQVLGSEVILNWLKPDVAGSPGIPPPGLMGYYIYRNGQKCDSTESPDTLHFENKDLFPGSYTYYISAKYDLASYGFSGTAESPKEGPVTAVVSYGIPLPFTEGWEQGSFSYNQWIFPDGGANWAIDNTDGNPLPSAVFLNNPGQNDYSVSLESTIFNSSEISCSKVWFDVDINLTDLNATGSEYLEIQIFYNNVWHTLEQFTNIGDIIWDHRHYDISAVKEKAFKIRFRAHGANSANIISWHVDNINLYAVCKPPSNLSAESSGDEVLLSWNPPVCEDGLPLIEGFEEPEFPPQGWDIQITNHNATWFHTDAGLPSGVHSGNYSASLPWDYSHQDERLIARNILVSGDLVFWSNCFQGSVHQDHYYVELSEDNGNTWQVLLDLSALAPYPSANGYNQWETPYSINLASWYGQVVDIAWHAVDGDGQGSWYSWSIDDCYTGTKKLTFGFLSGYDIYRKASGDPDYLKIATVPENQTVFTDINLDDGSYAYYITQSSSECSTRISSDTTFIDVITGMKNQEKKRIKVFPNPSQDYITIEAGEPVTSVEIFDNNGKCIAKFNSFITDTVTLNLSSVTPGIYFVKIITAHHVYNQKQIILN